MTNANGYEFNKSSIKDGIVNNAIIYGQNGVGKSNLALAIFDIIAHLTDKQKNKIEYTNYLNAHCASDEAHFYYELLIRSKIVVYEYRKTDYETIVYERLLIDGEEIVLFDRTNNSHATISFKGAETLKTNIENSQLSILKYIKNNTQLDNNETNIIFLSFFAFIDKMLFFRSLMESSYLGLAVGNRSALEDIVERGNVKNFETFLNQAGIECRLTEIEEFGTKSIAFNINGKLLPFKEIASTGTAVLTTFYFWYQDIKENAKVSFLFIDEFDAFYHHSLSKLIVEKLKETGVQFILTTHNTSIMTNDLLRPDCYFEMTKKRIRSFSKSTQKELREAHNIEKMYKAGSFNVN